MLFNDLKAQIFNMLLFWLNIVACSLIFAHAKLRSYESIFLSSIYQTNLPWVDIASSDIKQISMGLESCTRRRLRYRQWQIHRHTNDTSIPFLFYTLAIFFLEIAAAIYEGLFDRDERQIAEWATNVGHHVCCRPISKFKCSYRPKHIEICPKSHLDKYHFQKFSWGSPYTPLGGHRPSLQDPSPRLYPYRHSSPKCLDTIVISTD